MNSLCARAAVTLLLTLPTVSFAIEVDVEATRTISDLVCTPSRAPLRSTTPSNQEEIEPPAFDELQEVLLSNTPSKFKKIPLDIHKQSEVLTIGIWGDSHSAANFFSEGIISSLGVDKNQFRPTFIAPTMGRGGVRLPVKKYCKSAGWTFSLAYTSKGENLQYAPSLSNITSNSLGANISIDFRFPDNQPALNSLVILLKPSSEESIVTIGVDSNTYENIAVPIGEDRIALKSHNPFSIVKIDVISGAISIEGFLPSYASNPDLYLDTFGIPGATARGWRVIDSKYMKSKLEGHNYDLAILEYGTNEGADKNFEPNSYQEALTSTLKKFKEVFPDTQCVLIGPTDRGILVRRQLAKSKTGKEKSNKIKITKQAKSIRYVDLMKYSNVHQKISEIQNATAQQFGCSFWSWQEAMGGLGASYNWYYRTPRLMAKDLIHLTAPGYQESARSFIESISLKNIFNDKR